MPWENGILVTGTEIWFALLTHFVLYQTKYSAYMLKSTLEITNSKLAHKRWVGGVGRHAITYFVTSARSTKTFLFVASLVKTKGV